MNDRTHAELINAEFNKLDKTTEVVGEALLAEIERLRALLRQLPASLGITERDITGQTREKLNEAN